MKRLFPAIVLSLLILALAPVIGEVRSFFFDRFPDSATRILAAAFALTLVLLTAFALTRIRERRLPRYGGLAVVLILLWLQARGFSRADLAVTLVERVHIVEYGLLAILLYHAFRPRGVPAAVVLPFLWASLVGVFDEWVQWFAPQRIGEIRDVAMNAAAAVTGVLFALCLWPPPAAPARSSVRRHALRALALLLASGGLFFVTAHLGHEIHDPEIGTFRSWHTAEELRRLSARRAIEWDVPNPPTGRELCCIQDYYLTEAARHLQHRNQSFHDGHWELAWRANRILEKYYPAYLDKPLPGGRRPRAGKHMAKVLRERGTPKGPGGYVSPVFRDRIYTRPSKPVFLSVLATLVAALWLASLRATAGRVDDA